MNSEPIGQAPSQPQSEPIFLMPEAYTTFVRLVGAAAGLCIFLIMIGYNSAKPPSYQRVIIHSREARVPHDALSPMIAPPLVAAESSDTLTFVAIQMQRKSVPDGPAAVDAPTAAAPTAIEEPGTGGPSRTVKIDLSGAGRNGLVVFTEQNIELNVVSGDAKPGQGLMGLESRYQPKVTTKLSRPLSGVVTTQSTARSIALGNATPAELSVMCRSFISWTQRYGLRAQDVKFVLFRDPSEINYSGHAWVSNGRLADRYDGNELKTKCRNY